MPKQALGSLSEDDLELRGSDLVLLLMAADTTIATAQDRINGVTRLEKLLYLVEQETDVPDAVRIERLNFKPYNYGPFSRDVYQGVETLESADLVIEERRPSGRSDDALEALDMIEEGEDDEYVERCYVLTPKGKAIASFLAKQYPDVDASLSSIKNKYAGLSLSALIRYVYRTYPESTVNSKIRDQ